MADVWFTCTESNADYAERVCTMILSDYVSDDDDSIDDGTGYDGHYVEPRECGADCVE